MNIFLVTPARKSSRSGNRTSANRWARLLTRQGHQVTVRCDYAGETTDLLIALHAWRSAPSVQRYRAQFPSAPLIVALGGTDVNTYLKTDSQTTLATMQTADALVGLHDLIAEAIPVALRPRLHIIKQSARPLPGPRKPRKRWFGVSVIGHLRTEKDPFRAALAARLLPAGSRIRITHLGRAHSPAWAEAARREMRENPRYEWKGEVDGSRVRSELAKTHLMVISSRQEGGANVVSEALVAGVPILASNIPGNVGLLGRDYPGYYPVADESSLATLLERAESEPAFLQRLTEHCRRLAPAFTPEQEARGWDEVIRSVMESE